MNSYDDSVFAPRHDQLLQLGKKHNALITGMQSLAHVVTAYFIDNTLSLEEKRRSVLFVLNALNGDLKEVMRIVNGKKSDQQIEKVYLLQDQNKGDFYLGYRKKNSSFWSIQKLSFSNYVDRSRPVRANISNEVHELKNLWEYYKYDINSFISNIQRVIDFLNGRGQTLFTLSLAEFNSAMKELNRFFVNRANISA